MEDKTKVKLKPNLSNTSRYQSAAVIVVQYYSLMNNACKCSYLFGIISVTLQLCMWCWNSTQTRCLISHSAKLRWFTNKIACKGRNMRRIYVSGKANVLCVHIFDNWVLELLISFIYLILKSNFGFLWLKYRSPRRKNIN